MNYIFEFHGRQYTPDGAVDVPSTSDHNAAIELSELSEWSTAPARAIAYVHFSTSAALVPFRGQSVTLATWNGTTIATGAVTGVFRNNLTGSRTVAIRVRGTNGARYTGRFGDEWSQACRIRRIGTAPAPAARSEVSQ